MMLVRLGRPDGTKIAFQSDRDLVGGRWDIWIVNADGTNPQNLTQNPAVDDMHSRLVA